MGEAMPGSTFRPVDRAPSGEDSDSRPVGEERSPILVPFLSYITLQFYLYYWIWKVGEELDDFDPYRDSPKQLARWGVPLVVAGTLTLGASLVALFVLLDTPVTDTLDSSQVTGGAVALVLVLVVGGLLMLVGSVILWVAYWRVWKFLESHEAHLGYDPINAGLMLALWIGSILVTGLVPVVGWAGQLGMRAYVLYRTQKGLNRVWSAGSDGYEAPQPTYAYGRDPGYGHGYGPGQAGSRQPSGTPPQGPQPTGHGAQGSQPAGGTNPATGTSFQPTEVAPTEPVPEATPSGTPGTEGVPFRCVACGNAERIPSRRPLLVTCPACGEEELLREGD